MPTEREWREAVRTEEVFIRQKQLKHRSDNRAEITRLQARIRELRKENKTPLPRLLKTHEAYEERIAYLRREAKERGWQVVEAKE